MVITIFAIFLYSKSKPLAIVRTMYNPARYDQEKEKLDAKARGRTSQFPTKAATIRGSESTFGLSPSGSGFAHSLRPRPHRVFLFLDLIPRSPCIVDQVEPNPMEHPLHAPDDMVPHYCSAKL